MQQRNGTLDRETISADARATASQCAVVLEWAAGLTAATFVLAYLFIAAHRLSYPFDLEWMEGSMVHHVWRVLAGQPIYGPPTLDFTPFLYPPLYYYVSAAVARVTGLGFLPLRLVSVVSSIAVFWFIYRLAERDTRSRYAGVLAVGLFAATYRLGGAWFDLARNDSLFLALLLATVYLVRFRESSAGWAWAGLLLALSALTKQTALLMSLPLFLYAALVNRRKAMGLALAFGAVLGGVTATYHLRDHGWYAFYVLRLPARIQESAAERAPFWTHDILGSMPIASVLAVAALVTLVPWRDRRSAFWPLIAASSLGAAWISRLHSGAYDNVVIPAYACLAVLAAIASRRIPDRAAPSHRPFVRLAIAVLCVVQLVALRYPVQDQLPTAHDAELWRDLELRIAAVHADVLVPFHSFVPTPSGPVMHAHSWAVMDVLRSGDAATKEQLARDIASALDRRQFGMVVIDKIEPWMEPDLDTWYRRSEPALATDGLWTRTGYRTHPMWIYLPR